MNFRPSNPGELVGPASRIASVQLAKIAKLDARRDRAKLLFYGPPGTGKTTIAELVALSLTSGVRLAIDESNGREVTIETVRGWIRSLSYRNLFGDWSVKIVNELDLCSREAQDLMLTYLDRLPPGMALIGTSNLQIDLLTDRFQTRFQPIKVPPPDTDELKAFLREFWPEVPEFIASQIAVGSGGCVRAALLDLESWFDTQLEGGAQ